LQQHRQLAAAVTIDRAKLQSPQIWARTPPAEDPASTNGLHQLAFAGFGPVKLEKEPIDFGGYRSGSNNRTLYKRITDDLDALFDVKIPYRYSRTLEAFPRIVEGPISFGFSGRGSGGYAISEPGLDLMISPYREPQERRAIASFAIAHEFFHAYLRHADMSNWGTERPRGFTIKDHARYEHVFELQADYLATKYLMLRGLPAEPVIHMFESGEFPETHSHPAGPRRAENVRRALEPGFELELFSNEVVDCLKFLDALATL
jgi:hypothetical protein